jgi:hypothetical protein
VNLIALRAFGSIGLYSFVAIRRRHSGQITTGCFGRGPMPEKLNTIQRTCQSGEIGHYRQIRMTPLRRHMLDKYDNRRHLAEANPTGKS